jgi:hypothetical protein
VEEQAVAAVTAAEDEGGDKKKRSLDTKEEVSLLSSSVCIVTFDLFT